MDGSWGSWDSWSPCSKTCKPSGEIAGQRSRSRECNNPPPSGGGTYCVEAPFEDQDCNTEPCNGMSVACF